MSIGIGIIGLGGFGMFAAQQFAQVPGAKLRCISGTSREASVTAAARFAVSPTSRTSTPCSPCADVDLVYIATPPFLHYEQTKAALRAGKHVIVEKPLSMTMAEASEASSRSPPTSAS